MILGSGAFLSFYLVLFGITVVALAVAWVVGSTTAGAFHRAPSTVITTSAASSIPSTAPAQFKRVARILKTNFEATDRAQRLHGAAGEQIGAAHYALQNLADELAGIMTPSTSLQHGLQRRRSVRAVSSRDAA